MAHKLNGTLSTLVGQFYEKEHGRCFQYEPLEALDKYMFDHVAAEIGEGYDMAVWVSNDTHGHCAGYRAAKVLKTVVYIVTGSGEDGNGVEKWNIKRHEKYVR